MSIRFLRRRSADDVRRAHEGESVNPLGLCTYLVCALSPAIGIFERRKILKKKKKLAQAGRV